MAEDVVIGRIAVKVMPDTTEFRDKAKQELRDIERSLKDVKVDLKLDDNKIVERARKLNAQVDRALKDQSIRVNLDSERSLTAAIGRVNRELERLGEKSIPLEVDEDGLKEQLDGFKADLDRVAKVDVEFNPSGIRSMEQAISKIDKELDKVRSITIDANLNEADLGAARELIEEELGKAVKVKVEADDAAYAKIRKQIDTVFDDLIIHPDLDPSKVNQKLRQIEKLIEQIDNKKIELEAALNERDKRAIEREIEDLQDKLDDLKGEIQIDISEPGKAHAQASLAVLTRDRIVHLIPIVSKTAAANAATALAALSGARLAGDILDKLWNSVKNLDKAAPIIGGVALAVAGLGAVGIAAAAELASLAVSLAQIGPAALALPGILGGLVIGLGVTIVAFQDFNNRLPEVGKALTVLKGQMQDNFWSAAQKPIQTLVDTLLPQFSAGVNKVSGELGGFFAKLATGLTGSFDGALAGMFDDLSASIRIASGATDAMADILKILGEVGAGYLPRLAAWFVDITEKFSAFLTTSRGNGELKRWIDQGIAALIAFGMVIANTAKILSGLGAAAQAAGGSTLSALADGLGNVAAVVQSPAFQTGLTSVFASAYEALNNIANVAGPAVEKFFATLPGLLDAILPVAGTAIGGLVKGFAELMATPAFQGGLIALFEGIGKAVTALAPAFGPVGTALGALGSLMGTFIATVGPVIAQVFLVLADVLTQLAPALEPVVQILGGALLAAVQAITPLFANLGEVIAGLVSGGAFSSFAAAAQGILPALAPLGPLVGDVLVSAFQAIVSVLGPVATLFATLVPIVANFAAAVLPVVGPLLEALGATIGTIVAALTPFIAKVLEIATAILGPLITAIVPVITEHLPQLGAAFQDLVTALTPVLNMLQTVVDFIMPYLIPALTAIASTLLDNVVVAFNFVVDVIKAAVKIIQGLWDIIAGIFTGDWSRLWTGVKEVFGGVWDAIVALFKGVVQVIVNTFQNMATLSAERWNNLWNGVKSTASGVWNWLTSTWSSITRSLASIGSSAWNAIGSAFSSLGSTLRSTASSMWESVKSAFTNGVNRSIALVRGLPDAAKAALGNLGDVLVAAGRSLIQGLIDGIKAMIGQVQATLGSLTAMLPDWKGPASRDATLLTGAGQLIMDGFIAGLESRYNLVRKSLSGLTRDIGDMTVQAPRISATASGLTASVTGALDNGTTGTGTQKILNYYAAPGSSIDSEEDLFAASSRARMVGW